MSSSHWQEVLREGLLTVECAPNLVRWSQLAERAQHQAYLISLPTEMTIVQCFSCSPLPLKKGRLMWVYNRYAKIFHFSHVRRQVKYTLQKK